MGFAGLLCVVVARAAEPISFSRQVAPILQARCLACHRAEKAKGKYRLDTFEELLKPGAGGEPPVASGDPGKSALHRLLILTDPDDRMPQDADPLPALEVGVIRRWIEEGARFDGSDPHSPLAALIPRQAYPEPPGSYRFAVPASALAFSPDGNEIAVAGLNEVTVWNSTNGLLSRRIANLPERILSLAWRTNGLAVAGGSPGRAGEAVVVDPSSGRLQMSLLSASDSVPVVRFSPDGTRIAVGGTDGVIAIFDSLTGARLKVLPAHADWVMALDWSADAGRIVSASRDRTARVADALSGEGVASFTEHGSSVWAAVFEPEGKRVWSSGRDHNIRIWDAAGSDLRSTFQTGGAEVTALLAVPAGVLSAWDDGVVRLHPWKTPEKAEIYQIGGRVLSLAADATGARFAAGTHDGGVRIWRRGDKNALCQFTAAPGLLR
jgi:WD40 repeat protein